MVRGWVGRAALGVAALLVGCAGSRDLAVRSSFSSFFECDVEQIKVARTEVGAYQASGCGMSASYHCTHRGCEMDRPAEARPVADRDAVEELRLTISLEDGVVLGLVAAPTASEMAELSLGGRMKRGCGLDLMLDGQRLELTAGSTDASRMLPRDVMQELGTAQQVVLRVCDRRWWLGERDLVEVRRLVARYEEDLAWRGTARTGSSGGRHAPLGGWQPWRALDTFPAAVAADAALTGTQLFEKLAPSVWRVESKLEGGLAQGSAVAVTKNRLVTNCHVVEGALKVVIKQGKIEAVAKVQASDPAKDRCVLEVADAPLKPVGGVRPYVDLKVGEVLYTLGAPSGLDLTLADGILSALREDQGVRYVQTTAPISPGSSGGGLFDARGNLVGITTLVFVGKEHLNQSLNFAIAAEMFWSP